jgi:hypothetical protein
MGWELLPDWLRIVTLLISTSQAAKAWATSPGLLLILKKKRKKERKSEKDTVRVSMVK